MLDKADFPGTHELPTLAGLQSEPFDVQCDVFRGLVAGVDEHLHRPKLLYGLLGLICQAWWEGTVTYSEGANESVCRHSFIQGFVDLTWHMYEGRLSPCVDNLHLVSARAPIVIIQMAARMMIPVSNGSGIEVPADEIARDYLTLEALTSLAFMEMLEVELQEALDSRRHILETALSDPTQPSSTRDLLLAVLTAQPRGRAPLEPQPEIKHHEDVQKLTKFAKYFTSAEYMKGEATLGIKLAILEGAFYTTLLQAARADCMFPLTESKEQDKYLEYIPPMSTIPSTNFERCCPPQWLFDLMLWSMFIFLVDEYMEAVVVHFSTSELADFCAGLELIHPDPDPRLSIITVPQLSTLGSKGDDGNASRSTRVQVALSVFYTWAQQVLNWDRLAQATATDMNQFRSEVKKYLLSHVHQIQDNIHFAGQQGRAPTVADPDAPLIPFESPRTAFTTWVHTVGAGHISAPVSLAFAASYMGSGVRGGHNGWSSVMQSMLAHEMNQHVGAYCRLYNDYGSVSRDMREGNLNSVNFPEFWTEIGEGADPLQTLTRVKATLLLVAKHERRMADLTASEFYQTLEQEENNQGPRIASALRVYFRSAELFSDMYIARDVTNTVK